MKKKTFVFVLGIVLILIVLIVTWTKGGFASFYLSTDLGRDLSEMSNIRMNKTVWLGPRLSPGFPISPVYYYLNYPILLIADWNANSLIVFNIILALTALVITALSGQKKWGVYSLIFILVMGLTPLYRLIAIQPGNGYTYAIWLFLFLVTAWFESPLFISSFFLGLAISYHPGAIFGLPILIYELLKRRSPLLIWGIVLSMLLIPWIPIIVFELITKGFIIRSFLNQGSPAIGLTQLNLENIRQIIKYTGLGQIVFIILFIFSAILAKNRLRKWFCLSLLSIPFFLFSHTFPAHYLLGITVILLFIYLLSVSSNRWGKAFISVIAGYFLIQAVFFLPDPKPARSISRINGVVEEYIKIGKLNKNDKVAVVSILDREVSVPQGDDYRYFLRVKGYDVLDVVNYSKADILLMFVEEPGFNWEKWSSWETDQFGQRRNQRITIIGGITIIKFTKT